MHLLGMQLTKTYCYYKAPSIFLFERERLGGGGGGKVLQFFLEKYFVTSPDSEAKKINI